MIPTITQQKKIQHSEDLSLYVFGKVPPQAIEIERVVLGAMLLEQEPLHGLVDQLHAEIFYDPVHQQIFQAIQQLHQSSRPVDIISVQEQLRVNGYLQNLDNPLYLTQLTNRVASTAHTEYHAQLLQQLYLKRELIQLGMQMVRRSYQESEDVLDIMADAEQQLHGLTNHLSKSKYATTHQLAVRAMEQIDKALGKKDALTGIGTGFKELDKATGGWQPSDLVIMAGRPGMGKTSFVLSLARNAAVDHKMPVAIFSLEMSSLQLMNRLIAAEANLSLTKIITGDLTITEVQKIQQKAALLAESPIYIDDTPAINVMELRARCRRLKHRHGIALIVVDYLQLMSGVEDFRRVSNRENEISNISRNLKKIAKELEIPIIALSQLSREVEKRNGKRPQLSDLRESGAIEQDADLVAFIYRPEYYHIEEDEAGNSTKGVAEIIIAKHRNGGLGSMQVQFTNWCAKFADREQ